MNPSTAEIPFYTHHAGSNPAAAQVHEFHKAFAHPVAYIPNEPDRKLKELRLKTLAEELAELGAAWGVRVLVKVECETTTNASNYTPGRQTVMELVRYDSDDVEVTEHPVVAAADAMVDMGYFLHGTAIVSGVPFQACFNEVHAANMAKIGPDGKITRRADGKILKPEGWKPADIAEVLRKFGWRG
jgi:predicted HAD superfamily Cof-like phosphohydrolase